MIDIYELSDRELLKRIGSNFKRMRLLMDISQKRLAEITGISRSTIVRFENGKPISTFYLVKIFRGIKSLDDLDKLFILPGYTSEEMHIISKKERKRASNN